MKKVLYTIAITLMTASICLAQTEDDALRYSQTFLGSTSRSMSMGGAFGALGGDFSSISTNPAGLGVYRRSEFTFTPSLNYSTNNSSYLETQSTDSRANLNINNLGFVGSYNSGKDKGWVSVNLGFGYNRLNNFYENMAIEGVNNQGSMIDYFRVMANGKTPDQLSAFYEGSAFMTYLIDTVSTLEYAGVIQGYNENALAEYGATQLKNITNKGGMGEYTIGLGANYSHKLYLGISFGIQSVNFSESYSYSETDPDNTINDFNSFDFEKRTETEGYGFNLKLGAIYRPIDWIRVGAAFHTRTFYSLNYKYDSYMYADYDVDNEGNVDVFTYTSPQGEYDYQVTSPFKAIGSIAFIIKKQALISIDYEYVDYSVTQMNSVDAGEFNDANSSMQVNYTGASNVRAGLEYRIGPFSIRGGAAYFGSPYANSPLSDSYKMAYCGGFGIKEGKIFFDIAYMYLTGKEKYYLYSPDVVENTPANITANSSRITATFGVRF